MWYLTLEVFVSLLFTRIFVAIIQRRHFVEEGIDIEVGGLKGLANLSIFFLFVRSLKMRKREREIKIEISTESNRYVKNLGIGHVEEEEQCCSDLSQTSLKWD